jgi:hypothetical protein
VIAAIISALAAFFKVVVSWISYARDKTLIALGGSRQQASSLQERLDALQKANRLREEARADLNRDSDGGMSDDGYRRIEKDGDV